MSKNRYAHKPETYTEPDDDNPSSNLHFSDILQARVTRRQTVIGGLSATTAALFGSLSLSACGGSSDNAPPATTPATPTTPPPAAKPALNFTAVGHSLDDIVKVPAGYSIGVLYALGDPQHFGDASWAGGGSETAESYERRAGDHHDGMRFFGLADDGTYAASRSDRGLLCLNHENITQVYLHPAGPTTVAGVRPAAEVDKEVNCHGVSVLELKRTTGNALQYVRGSALNRRLTAASRFAIEGPAAGTARMKTLYSTDGTATRGTVNNCANGYTPWGTYLTCEENWAGYFKRATTDGARTDTASLDRYGVKTGQAGNYGWSTPTGDLYRRWDTSATAAADGAGDYRNVANTFGWIVEIDPFDPAAMPVKRTALGRFGHEGCQPATPVEGQPLVFYMGDDSRNEYVYKFVSKAPWSAADKGLAAGAKYLNEGTLFVAKFNADGSGNWIALDKSNPALASFASNADILIDTRLAADAVGATKMDRPEWTAVHPVNGEVYLTLTNGTTAVRPQGATDAANPRPGNVNGHIVRWREANSRADATQFQWDVYLFGSPSAEAPGYNLSALTDNNDFSSPDGLWFDSRGVLWIETDDGAYTSTTNCMLLAATPGQVGDGGTITAGGGTQTFKGANPGEQNLRRFLVGPKECELTGIAMTPDNKTLIVNIQHPGEGGTISKLTSHWPESQTNAGSTARPRSATIFITKDDGGVIGV
jgi:secreted PhoX family phosphatase